MIEENQIKKQKKNNFKVALGTITILGGIGLATYGIKEYKENNEFTRIVTEDGNYELDGVISYDKLKKYSVVEIETIIGENKICIAKGEKYFRENVAYYDYKDIYSGEKIGINTSVVEDDTVISATNINDFLIAYDMIKAKYSSDDIEYLLNRIKEDYQNNKILKLLKTKDE